MSKNKEYRTAEQFEAIAESILNGNWSQGARECVEYGFYSSDLVSANKDNELFDDHYDLCELIELATNLRNK